MKNALRRVYAPAHKTRPATLAVEALEERSLPTAGLTALLQDGVLRIEGTDGDDIVRVRQVDNTVSVDYTLIQSSNGEAVKRVPAALVTKVEVRGRGGEDLIHLITTAADGQTSSFAPVVVETGTGNARLVSDTDAGRIQTWLGVGNSWSVANNELTLLTGNTEPLPAVVTPELPPALSAEEQNLLDRFNDYRVSHGLDPLRENVKLDEAATYQADYMARTGFYAHVNADGRDVADRVRAEGYRFGWIGETLHQYDPEIRRTTGIERYYERSELVSYLMDGWDASAAHREILLEGGVRDVGVGIAEAENGRIYAALLVGR